MKLLKQLLPVFLIVISLTSCFSYEEVKVKSIKSVKLLELSQKGLVVESEIELENPNSYEITVVDSEFDVFIKNTRIAKSKMDSKLVIPKNATNTHKVILRSDYKDLADGALSNMLVLTMGSKNIDFKIEGYIVGKVYFIKKKVDVSHSGKVPLKIF